MDRLEQPNGTLHQLRKPHAAHLDAGIAQALVLSIQRQVVRELIDHHPGDEAHVRPAALDHPSGRRRARQRQGVAALDQRAHILEDHVAARPLRQAMAHLLADHLELV
jgi:hypothetical protein